MAWSTTISHAQEIAPSLPVGRAAVFDIDGTLTPNVLSIWAARPDAALTLQRFADAGVLVIYLSARRPAFQAGLPGWLARNDFPTGPLHLVPDMAAHRDPVAFKRSVIEAYQAQGWQIIAAFGDSSSDFEAYAEAGVPSVRVAALARAGHDKCQPGPVQGCYPNWRALSEVTAPWLLP